ncbi:MAG: hydrogenase maturation protease [Candidatus Goldiibacteriota bacterium]
MKILVYGYGNPGRQDDALGFLFSEEIKKLAEKENITGIETDTNFQLNAEDSLLLKDKDAVVFVDASKEDVEDISFREIRPAGKIEFSTHFMRPESVLAFAAETFNAHPRSYMLAIKGYEWEFNMPLTEKARRNLDEALEFLMKKITENKL